MLKHLSFVHLKYSKELQFIHYSLQQFHMTAKIAPVIHEWTYDAMCHDLLEMDGNKYIYEVIVISYYSELQILSTFLIWQCYFLLQGIKDGFRT